jgi:hypothetical protein
MNEMVGADPVNVPQLDVTVDIHGDADEALAIPVLHPGLIQDGLHHSLAVGAALLFEKQHQPELARFAGFLQFLGQVAEGLREEVRARVARRRRVLGGELNREAQAERQQGQRQVADRLGGRPGATRQGHHLREFIGRPVSQASRRKSALAAIDGAPATGTGAPEGCQARLPTATRCR